MRVTKNGISFERWTEFTLRPNICSFTDDDGSILNINTVTLINMYMALENELMTTHGLTPEDFFKRTKTG
jgi:hypothetical protein